jgi:hypothetical protein
MGFLMASTRKNILGNVETTLANILTASNYNNDILAAQITRFQKNFFDTDGYDKSLLVLIAGEEGLHDDSAAHVENLLTVRVVGRIRSEQDLEDEVEDLAEDVETALTADRTRGGYADDTMKVAYLPLNAKSGDMMYFVMDFKIYYVYNYGTP